MPWWAVSITFGIRRRGKWERDAAPSWQETLREQCVMLKAYGNHSAEKPKANGVAKGRVNDRLMIVLAIFPLEGLDRASCCTRLPSHGGSKNGGGHWSVSMYAPKMPCMHETVMLLLDA